MAVPRLMRGAYTPDAVYTATDGYATKVLQRNWISRGLIRTPVPEPLAGKPRQYPWLAVAEIALMACASQSGISVSTVSAAMRLRLAQAAKAAGCEDIKNVEALSPYLPEFHATPNGRRYGWMIDTSPTSDGGAECSGHIPVYLVADGDEILARALASGVAVWIGVSDIALRVEALIGPAPRTK